MDELEAILKNYENINANKAAHIAMESIGKVVRDLFKRKFEESEGEDGKD